MTDADLERPTLTISEAAKAAGVDRRTIRRRLDADELPNAYRADGPKGTGTGPWSIPVTDLLAAGIHLHAPTAPDTHTASNDEQSELDLLRQELAEERTRRRVAEAVADERAHALERADAAISALRALTAGPDTGQPNASSTSTPRRRWWKRSG